MALSDWKRFKSKNPYEPYNWINKKKHLWLSIHYDIGFGENRNVTIYDLQDQRISGLNDLKTYYCKDLKEAMEKAKEFMENN